MPSSIAKKPLKWSGQQNDQKASIIPETELVEAEAEVAPVPEVAGPDLINGRNGRFAELTILVVSLPPNTSLWDYDLDFMI